MLCIMDRLGTAAAAVYETPSHGLAVKRWWAVHRSASPDSQCAALHCINTSAVAILLHIHYIARREW